MAWTVEVLGMSGTECWTVSDLPPHAQDQDRVVAARFPEVALERESRRGDRLRYIARPHGARRRLPGPELSLVAVGGPDAGHVVPFARHGITVGRADSRWRLADPAAPARPVRLSPSSSGLVVDDDGTAPWQDGAPVSVGTTDIVVVRGPGEGLPATSAPPAPRVDTSGAPAPMSPVLPVVMAVGPLLLGVVLAVTTGRAFFLLFGLLSVLAVATMLGLQRRSRTLFRRRLSRRVDELIDAREGSAPAPAAVSLACRSRVPDRFALAQGFRPDGRWSDSPALTLRWGTALGEVPLDDPVRQERWRRDAVRRQPALSTFSSGAVLTVCGAGPEHDGVLRWMLLQLLLQTSRHDLGLVVRTEDAGVLWRTGRTDCGVRVTVPSARAVAPIRRAWARNAAAAAHAAGPSSHEGDGWADVVVTEASAPAAGASVEEDRVDLGAAVFLSDQGQRLQDLVPDEISARTAAWWAAELASETTTTDPGRNEEAAPTPLRVPTAPGTLPAVDALVAPLTGSGGGAGGGTDLDLVSDGPHVLVAGTTGSGKSDLLLGMLTGLCATHPPAEVALVLLDFKGGASFSCLEGLPHTMSVETNHVDAASLRAFDAIGAELRRREELFARHRVSDYPSYRRAVPAAVLPRLVVAVDELRVLVDEHPESSEVLRRLAATGRSLGFHLVLATQRATGTVTSDIRSNLGSVLCLRTASEQESWDLTGSAVAARIPRDRPGTVVHVRQGSETRTFRAATWARSDAPRRWRRHDTRMQDPVTPTAWNEVISELAELSRVAEPVLPDPILSPPLPETWAPGTAGSPSAVPLALVDDTAAGRHRRLDWEAGITGSTAWLVESGGGRDLLLGRLSQDLTAVGERVLHLDGLGALSPAPPHWTRMAPDPDGDADPLDRVLSEVDALSRSGGTLLITGWAAWSSLRCPTTYRGLEELLLQRLGTDAAQRLRVAAVGGRELSSSRLLAQLPRRLHVPAGTTPEQRMMWPRLTDVLPVPGRAVLVDADHPEPGVPAQLPFPAHPPLPAQGAGRSAPKSTRE